MHFFPSNQLGNKLELLFDIQKNLNILNGSGQWQPLERRLKWPIVLANLCINFHYRINILNAKKFSRTFYILTRFGKKISIHKFLHEFNYHPT